MVRSTELSACSCDFCERVFCKPARRCPAGIQFENFSMRNDDRLQDPKAARVSPKRGRHKFNRISSRQSDAVIAAIKIIADQHNATVPTSWAKRPK